MYTHLEMEAMRRQCGNAGRETPGNPRAMIRFGNHRRVKGLHKDTGLGRTKAGRNTLRGLIHSHKANILKSRRLLNQALVLSREVIPMQEQSLRDMKVLRNAHRTLDAVVYTVVH